MILYDLLSIYIDDAYDDSDDGNTNDAADDHDHRHHVTSTKS